MRVAFLFVLRDLALPAQSEFQQCKRYCRCRDDCPARDRTAKGAKLDGPPKPLTGAEGERELKSRNDFMCKEARRIYKERKEEAKTNPRGPAFLEILNPPDAGDEPCGPCTTMGGPTPMPSPSAPGGLRRPGDPEIPSEEDKVRMMDPKERAEWEKEQRGIIAGICNRISGSHMPPREDEAADVNLHDPDTVCKKCGQDSGVFLQEEEVSTSVYVDENPLCHCDEMNRWTERGKDRRSDDEKKIAGPPKAKGPHAAKDDVKKRGFEKQQKDWKDSTKDKSKNDVPRKPCRYGDSTCQHDTLEIGGLLQTSAADDFDNHAFLKRLRRAHQALRGKHK